MPDIQLIKDISIIASPLIKTVVELWIAPKINEIGKKWIKNKKIQDHFFKNKFEEYLLEKYKKYSILNVLAFRNQRRLLIDLYQPLTIETTLLKKNASSKKYTIENYNDDLLPHYKKILITDTAGMGKSTLSKKLFLSVIDNAKGIPVFIELRRLNENRQIEDEIFDELKLINEEIDKGFILDLIQRGDFIFFFDGYDEISTKDIKKVTEDLQKFISKANKNYFILTSRPEDSLVSFGDFQAFSINPLKKTEANELLRKYDENGELSKSLIEKLEEEPYENINEFLVNPFLVSLLFTAFEYKHTIPLKKHLFYRQVFDALFEAHDLTKGDYFIRDKHSKLSIDDFHTVMRYIGFICLKRDKIEFSKDEILELINEANVQCEVIDFGESNLLKDLISTVPLFTKDGLYYKWAHKSLFEYFAAQFIYLDAKENQKKILKSLFLMPESVKFSNIFDLYSNIDYKTFRNVILYEYAKLFIEYCDETYNEIDIDKKVIRERQELTFNENHIIIKINNQLKESGNKPSDVGFKIIKDKLGKSESEGYYFVSSIYINKHIGKLDNLYCFSSVESNILAEINYIIQSKNEKIIKEVDELLEVEDIEKNSLQYNELYFVNDKNDNPLNSENNFRAANILIKVYKTSDYILDYNECKRLIKKTEELDTNTRSNFYEL